MSLLRLIPAYWRNRWETGITLRRVTGNVVWLGAESLLRLVIAFFVGAWVARALGPSQFGLLNYATAFCAPFAAFVALGINSLVVRDLARETEFEKEILGSAFGLKLCGAVMGFVVGGAAIMLTPRVDARALGLIAITLASLFLQTGDVLDLWFQGRGEARIPAWIRSGSSLLTNALKVGLVLLDASLYWFAVASVVELLFTMLGCLIAYYRRCTGSRQWQWNGARARRLLAEAWPLAGAGVAIQIQAYCDQVLLGSMSSAEEVGIYAAAIRLVAVFGFLPVAVATAAAPEITRAYASGKPTYYRRIRDVYRFMLLAGLLMGLPLLVMPITIVKMVFGPIFLPAAVLLPLMSIRVLLGNLGVARGLFLTNENMFTHAFITACVGAVLNIILNLIFIPRWGAMGCVVSSLLSFTANVVLCEVLHPRGRINLRLMLSAIGLGRVPE
ncbi:MAG: flippase [Verrucomicrobia bacterium]|nr:flippase [Verrucomicrobiota bacterium]